MPFNTRPGIAAKMHLDSSVEAQMDAFDILPKPYRKCLANAPYNVNAHDAMRLPVQSLKIWLDDVVRKSALETYGPDHPQAK